MKNTYDFAQDLQTIQTRINQFLQTRLTQIDTSPSPLIDAMKYGVLLGGKRIRPFLLYATGRMLEVDLNRLDHAAAAIEAIHAYSLIHDDLPAMDNDILRRGQPTCHIAFDEATAILAGDALQSFAFECLANATELSSEQKLRLIKVLCHGAGAQGMCLGQSLDLISENTQISLSALEQIHRNKTGALLSAAVAMGFHCSRYFDDAQLEAHLARYTAAVGLAFQVQDDILDIEGESEITGKSVGSDITADKCTYPKLLGLDGAKQKAQELYQTALAELEHISFDTTPLNALAKFVVDRRN